MSVANAQSQRIIAFQYIDLNWKNNNFHEKNPKVCIEIFQSSLSVMARLDKFNDAAEFNKTKPTCI